jgi:trigger factor
VNVTVDDLGSCRKLLKFEVGAQEVEAAFEATEREYQKHAALPGFRPGKAPREMVLKRFEKEIADETKRNLISENYQAAVKEKKLDVVNVVNVEEGQFARGQVMTFVATVEAAPDYPLPEYRGLPARREMATVTDEDVERAIHSLRQQRATFLKVDRAVQPGDFAVVNYAGTCEGKPITDLAPAARGLTQQKNFWIEVKKDSFIPGFAEQLAGAQAGEKRTVTVDFPADFVTPQVAGKKGQYEVEVVEVKERILPELNDAFAQSWEAENVDKLRAGVRSDLQSELNQRQRRSIRNQVLHALLDRVHFELPDSFVQEETRAAVYNIVNENQQRGVAKELIEQQKENIYAAASQSARQRVKAAFLFQKIAEKEGIRVLPEEVNARIAVLARANDMPADKYFKELEKRKGVGEIVQQLLHERVIDFLQENARIEDVPPAAHAAG